MIRLKRRRPLDTLRTESRRRQVSRGRWIYLAIILAALVWAFDALVGPMIYLKTDGMVIAKQFNVATEYTATVQHVAVTEGQRVEAGDLLLRVSSQDIAEKIADLSLRVADGRNKLAEYRVRANLAEELSAAARERTEADALAKENLSGLYERGLVTSTRRAQAIREAYRSLADRRLLTAEAHTRRAQLDALTDALDQAEKAFAQLVETYAGGRIVAPASGIVTALDVEVGAVVNAGDKLLELQNGPRRVVGYLPTGKMYSVRVGSEVIMRSGPLPYYGRITAIQPVAVALPAELQRRFQPVERAQVAIIDFRNPRSAPPLFTKVSLVSAVWPFTWTSSVGRMLWGDKGRQASAAVDAAAVVAANDDIE